MKVNTIRSLILISALSLSAILGFGMYRLGLQQGSQQISNSLTMPKPSSSERKVLYWHDPMVPGTRFEQPGKSPFMEMQLVPVYADANAVASGVSIDPRMQQNLGIRLASVTRGKSADSLHAVANVAYDDSELVLVQARSNAYIEKLYVHSPMESVRKGQKLAELYVPEWVALQEDFFALRRMPGKLPELLDAARQRMLLAGMSAQQLAQIENAASVQTHFTLTAPASGVVSELAARQGMSVPGGATLFRINGLDRVWVYAEIAENNIARIRPGSKAELRSTALPGQLLHGVVQSILPEVNPATRTFKARIVMDNPGQRLIPGMFAELTVMPAQQRELLQIPTEAIIQTGSRSVVMLAQAGGTFLAVEVEVGTAANGQSEILKGLEAGQQVVASGQFLIDSEASLKGGIARMALPTAATQHYQTRGKIEEIKQDEVVISHQAIASLKWDAMTMGFKTPAQGLPANLKVGSEVNFEFSIAGNAQHKIHQITRIELAELGKPAGSKP